MAAADTPLTGKRGEAFAHAHDTGEHAGNICFLRLKSRNGHLYWCDHLTTTTMLHEIAHIATPNHNHDRSWRQSFTALLEAYPPTNRSTHTMGRPAIHDRPMTGAERSRLYRQRKR